MNLKPIMDLIGEVAGIVGPLGALGANVVPLIMKLLEARDAVGIAPTDEEWAEIDAKLSELSLMLNQDPPPPAEEPEA